MTVVMALALGVITFKVVELQAVRDPHIAQLARTQSVFSTPLDAPRGSILDRNGEVLALSLPRTTVFADPSMVRHPERLASALSPLLDRSVPDLVADLQQTGTRYVPLARAVEPSVVRRIRALDDPGIGFVDSAKRFAPGGSLAGPVLGTVSDTGAGRGGLEAAYDRVLRGRTGRLEAERDPNGRLIPAADRQETPAVAGSDLVLTLDQGLQYQVEQHLVSEVTAVKAKAGMAVIADVHTGDILALAQVDGPTPTTPARPSPPTESSRLFTNAFEPGSTAKVITAASALESGAIGLDTHFSVPPSIKVGDGVYTDDEPHGTEWWTVRDILTRSSNVGAIGIAHEVGQVALNRWMRDFGFGARTPVQFPGESFGIMPSSTTDDGSIMGSMPIGYGIAVTPMQMLQVFMTVANGGETRPLRLVDGTVGPDGRRHTVEARPSRRVISEQTAATLRDILTEVVTSGTGVKAAVPGVPTAGKTGTARKPPYQPPLHYMASFAGFVPASSPDLAAMVVLDDPATEVHGGAVAAPVFSEIMQDALHLRAAQASPPAG